MTNQMNIINSQQNVIKTLQNNVATLTTSVADLRHIEQGVLDCQGTNSHWFDGQVPHPGGGHGNYDKTRQLTKSFNTTYKSPPVVFLSTSYRWVSKDNNVEYGTKLLEVTQENFTMLCGGDNNPDDYLSDMEVDWLSIPV